MPVTLADYLFIDEKFTDRDGTPFNAMDGMGTREYVRFFHVEMRTVEADPISVCLCPGLPLPYASYLPRSGTPDLNALLVKMNAKQIADSDGRHWLVTCNYSSDLSKANPGNFGFPVDAQGNPKSGAQNNPELSLPELEWDYEESMISRFEDIKGKPFLNSAWTPFSPAPQIPVHRPILILTRNELNFDPERASLFAGTVNDDTFLNYPAGCVLCMAPKVKLMNNKGPSYWRVTYRFKFGYKLAEVDDEGVVINTDYETFQHKELDQGPAERKLVGAPVQIALGGGAIGWKQKFVQIPFVGSGYSTAKQVMLDGAGRKQTRMVVDADGNILYPRPEWIDFTVRRSLDFTSLFNRGLGQGFPPSQP